MPDTTARTGPRKLQVEGKPDPLQRIPIRKPRLLNQDLASPSQVAVAHYLKLIRDGQTITLPLILQADQEPTRQHSYSIRVDPSRQS